MKNRELIKAMADRAGATQKTIKAILNAQAEIITEQLRANEEIVLHRSLGTFKTEPKAEKTVKLNLQEGKMTTVPAHIRLTFKVSKKLKNAVNL